MSGRHGEMDSTKIYDVYLKEMQETIFANVLPHFS